ncbi:hypothetical protein KXW53_008579, partial [Aspergillus fumigatus]
EYSISRWIECNNVIKALPQLAASLHDLLKPLVVAATGDTADSADEDAQAELIQTHAEACLRQMLGQASSRMGVQALDDLGLPQRDVDRMKDPGRLHQARAGRDASVPRLRPPTSALALAEKTGIYKSAEYVISDSEVGSGIDDEEGSGSESDGQSNSSSPGTDSGDSPSPSGRGHGSGAQDDDSNGNDGHGSDDHGNSGRRHGPSSRGRRPGTDDGHSNRRDNNNNDNDDNDDNNNNNNHGNSGCEPHNSNHNNPARHDNDNNDNRRDPGHRAAPTPEESEAAQARLLEVYRNAQDAAITELRQSDPTHAQQLALLQS